MSHSSDTDADAPAPTDITLSALGFSADGPPFLKFDVALPEGQSTNGQFDLELNLIHHHGRPMLAPTAQGTVLDFIDPAIAYQFVDALLDAGRYTVFTAYQPASWEADEDLAVVTEELLDRELLHADPVRPPRENRNNYRRMRKHLSSYA